MSTLAQSRQLSVALFNHTPERVAHVVFVGAAGRIVDDGYISIPLILENRSSDNEQALICRVDGSDVVFQGPTKTTVVEQRITSKDCVEIAISLPPRAVALLLFGIREKKNRFKVTLSGPSYGEDVWQYNTYRATVGSLTEVRGVLAAQNVQPEKRCSHAQVFVIRSSRDGRTAEIAPGAYTPLLGGTMHMTDVFTLLDSNATLFIPGDGNGGAASDRDQTRELSVRDTMRQLTEREIGTSW